MFTRRIRHKMMKTTIAAALALALASGAAMAEFKDFTVNGQPSRKRLRAKPSRAIPIRMK